MICAKDRCVIVTAGGRHEVREIEKAEDGRKHHQKGERRCKRAARFFAEQPECNKQNKRSERIKILRPDALVDLPRRINQHQIFRPKKFAEIKPKEPAGNENAIEQRIMEGLAILSAEFLFDPNRHNRGSDSNHKKRNKRLNISLPPQTAALPPKDRQ